MTKKKKKKKLKDAKMPKWKLYKILYKKYQFPDIFKAGISTYVNFRNFRPLYVPPSNNENGHLITRGINFQLNGKVSSINKTELDLAIKKYGKKS